MTASLAAPYPCDRGIKNNVLARGYHNFVLTADASRAVCSLCGQPSAYPVDIAPDS